jgi:cytochrome c
MTRRDRRGLLSLGFALLTLTGLAGAHRGQAAKPVPPAMAAGDPVSGARLYQSCMGCHSLDENDVGPKHRGVVGRVAGTAPGYAYSVTLRKSGIVWTPQNIDRWLTNPQAMVPGAKMYFSVAKPRDRADIIAYLAQQR